MARPRDPGIDRRLVAACVELLDERGRAGLSRAQIAERAGALYEKVVGFLGTMDKIGANLDRAQMSFADARAQLSTGKGNVVRQVEMLRELGAKSGKPLPSCWSDGSEEPPLLRVVGDEPGDLR